jgi:capsid protein
MVDESVLLGQCSIEPRNWERRPWVYHEHCWTPPAWLYAITPGEEIKANIESVENNHRTLASVVGETGEDLEEVLNARQREMKMQRDRAILPPKVQEAESAALPLQHLAQQAEVANGK